MKICDICWSFGHIFSSETAHQEQTGRSRRQTPGNVWVCWAVLAIAWVELRNANLQGASKEHPPHRQLIYLRLWNRTTPYLESVYFLLRFKEIHQEIQILFCFTWWQECPLLHSWGHSARVPGCTLYMGLLLYLFVYFYNESPPINVECLHWPILDVEGC